MYLHLGQNTVTADEEVIGIFDIDNTTSSKITRDFLNRAERDGRVSSVSDDIPRSFVLCTGERRHITDDFDDKSKVYLSQLSTATLLKRSELLIEDM